MELEKLYNGGHKIINDLQNKNIGTDFLNKENIKIIGLITVILILYSFKKYIFIGVVMFLMYMFLSSYYDSNGIVSKVSNTINSFRGLRGGNLKQTLINLIPGMGSSKYYNDDDNEVDNGDGDSGDGDGDSGDGDGNEGDNDRRTSRREARLEARLEIQRLKSRGLQKEANQLERELQKEIERQERQDARKDSKLEILRLERKGFKREARQLQNELEKQEKQAVKEAERQEQQFQKELEKLGQQFQNKYERQDQQFQNKYEKQDQQFQKEYERQDQQFQKEYERQYTQSSNQLAKLEEIKNERNEFRRTANQLQRQLDRYESNDNEEIIEEFVNSNTLDNLTLYRNSVDTHPFTPYNVYP